MSTTGRQPARLGQPAGGRASRLCCCGGAGAGTSQRRGDRGGRARSADQPRKRAGQAERQHGCEDRPERGPSLPCRLAWMGGRTAPRAGGPQRPSGRAAMPRWSRASPTSRRFRRSGATHRQRVRRGWTAPRGSSCAACDDVGAVSASCCRRRGQRPGRPGRPGHRPDGSGGSSWATSHRGSDGLRRSGCLGATSNKVRLVG
jgi:hypothetical protein